MTINLTNYKILAQIIQKQLYDNVLSIGKFY